MMRMLNLPNRGGKTYQSLKWLSDRGGGVFVTVEPLEVEKYIERFGFKDIQVVAAHRMVVDNIDAIDSMVTYTFPATITFGGL